jgi:hypothetical protein
MTPWTDPEVSFECCVRGDEVLVVDRATELRAGGEVKARVRYRTITCQKTGKGGLEFNLGHHESWMCEDCNLVR